VIIPAGAVLHVGHGDSFSRGLDKLVYKQVLNILGQDDADQSPLPLQQSKLKTEALLLRQGGRPHDFEPAEAILGIPKNLPNGPNRVRCYSDRTWWWSIWHHSYRPTNGEQLGQRFG
jgi:hypothetical protein